MTETDWKKIDAQKRVAQEKRRALVREGLSKMMTGVQILKHLEYNGVKVSMKTVDRDIKIVKKELIEEITKSKEPVHQVLSTYLMRHNQTYKELNKLIENTEDDRVKAQCLRTKANMEDSFVKALQTLGLVTHKAGELDGQIVVRWKTPEEAEKAKGN